MERNQREHAIAAGNVITLKGAPVRSFQPLRGWRARVAHSHSQWPHAQSLKFQYTKGAITRVGGNYTSTGVTYQFRLITRK